MENGWHLLALRFQGNRFPFNRRRFISFRLCFCAYKIQNNIRTFVVEQFLRNVHSFVFFFSADEPTVPPFTQPFTCICNFCNLIKSLCVKARGILRLYGFSFYVHCKIFPFPPSRTAHSILRFVQTQKHLQNDENLIDVEVSTLPSFAQAEELSAANGRAGFEVQ